MLGLGSRGAMALAAAALASACAAPEPAPVEMVERITSSAVVQTVDPETRQVLLKADDGSLLTIVAGPEVGDLSDLEPGDKVVAVYENSVAARMAATDAPAETALVAVAPEPGDKPGLVAAQSVTGIVTFLSYDPRTHVATLRSSDGFVHAVVVETPEMRAFASRLRKGDRVELTFSTALAVAIEEAGG